MWNRKLMLAGLLVGGLAACKNDREQLAPEGTLERADESRDVVEDRREELAERRQEQAEVSLRHAEAALATAKASAAAARAEGAVADAQEQFARDRAVVVAQAERTLAVIDAEIASLQATNPSVNSPDPLDNEIDNSMLETLQGLRASAATELERLRSATPEDWENRVDKAVAVFDELQSARIKAYGSL
jgi:hypothetical protein